jgi:glutamyl-tRNA synthetase
MSFPPLPVVGRLAPSPTGGLHLGHARTFFVAWLAARSRGGRVILRIEDLDASRVRAEAASGAVEDLRWLGFDWDDGPDVGGPSAPYAQSERMAHYTDALKRLKTQDLIYPCTCSRAEIARAASAPHAEDEGPRYPGTCAGRSADDSRHLGEQPFAWRFRVPLGNVAWRDLFQGEITLDPFVAGGDFLVARNGVGPSYQLAVVVDDAAMRVTQVIRGLDLIPSTPRQILLYRALNCRIPTFGHIGLVLGPDGKRLAKRDGSVKLATLRAAGADPRRTVGQLAASLGLASLVEPSLPRDWVASFSAERVIRGDWTLGPEDVANIL